MFAKETVEYKNGSHYDYAFIYVTIQTIQVQDGT